MMISRPLLKEVHLALLSGEVLASECIPENGSVKNLNELLKNVGYVITEGTQYVKDNLKILASAIDAPIVTGLWYVVENQLEVGHLFSTDDGYGITERTCSGVRVDHTSMHVPMFCGKHEWDPIWLASVQFVPSERPRLSWEFKISADEVRAKIYHSFMSIDSIITATSQTELFTATYCIDASRNCTGLLDGEFVHASGEASTLCITLERGIPYWKDVRTTEEKKLLYYYPEGGAFIAQNSEDWSFSTYVQVSSSLLVECSHANGGSVYLWRYEDGVSYCEVCEMWLSTCHMEEHRNGKKHRRSLQRSMDNM